MEGPLAAQKVGKASPTVVNAGTPLQRAGEGWRLPVATLRMDEASPAAPVATQKEGSASSAMVRAEAPPWECWEESVTPEGGQNVRNGTAAGALL